MWGEAIRVTVMGFFMVMGGLIMLAIGIKIMSFFCRLIEKKKPINQANQAALCCCQNRQLHRREHDAWFGEC